jgi:hypothetical protein
MSYIVYFKNGDGSARTLNVESGKYETIDVMDLYKLKKKYALLTGYEITDGGLSKFANDFELWTSQLDKSTIIKKFKYKSFNSHEAVCKHIFEQLCHGKYEDIEDIDNIESQWIEKCNNGGLTYCKKGKYKCYGYDYSFQFPSILAMEHFKIATKGGIEKTIKNLNYPKIEMGFYRVRITSTDINFNKVWAYSEDNVYTHTSLMFAFKCQKKYAVNIELIIEDNNCYIYDENDLRKSNLIFGTWYRCLCTLKKEFPKNKLVKYMTSALWGRLCEHNRKFYTWEEMIEKKIDFSRKYHPDHKYYIHDVTFSRKKKVNVYELRNTERPYYYNIARMKPFLLSKSRSLTGTIAMEYIEDVIRIHTDNITFIKKHDDVLNMGSKTMKILEEDKTTGEKTFKSANCYYNETVNYKTKNFDKSMFGDESDDESDDDDN